MEKPIGLRLRMKKIEWQLLKEAAEKDRRSMSSYILHAAVVAAKKFLKSLKGDENE